MTKNPRHTASASGRHARANRPFRLRVSSAARIAASALAIASAAALALVLGSTSGTLALWNQNAPIADGGTITVGSSIDLSIATGSLAGTQGQITAAFPQGTWSSLLPGDRSGSEFTVTNQGSAPVRLSAAIDAQGADPGQVSFFLAQGQCQQGAPNGIAITSSPAVVGGASLAPNTSATYCLQVALSASAPANLQGTQIVSNFMLSLNAGQEATS